MLSRQRFTQYSINFSSGPAGREVLLDGKIRPTGNRVYTNTLVHAETRIPVLLTFLFGLLFIGFNAGCVSKEQEVMENFESLKIQFIDDLWELNPDWALAVGNYNFDDRLTIRDEKNRNSRDAFLEHYREALDDIPVDLLPALDQIDYRIIDNYLRSQVWDRDEFHSTIWNPANYNVAGSVGRVLNGRYAPLDDRMESLFRMLDLVPEYYSQARQSLDKPMRPHTELAVQQNQGTIQFLDGALRDSLSVLQEQNGDTEWTERYSSRIDRAVAAVEEYIDFINETWLGDIEPFKEEHGIGDGMSVRSRDTSGEESEPDCTENTDAYGDWESAGEIPIKESLADCGEVAVRDDANFRDFRIGSELYRQKFQFDNDSYYTADEIYELAVQRKNELHGEMLEFSADLWDKYHPGREMPNDLTRVQLVLNEIARDHVHRDSLVVSIKKQIPDLEAFIVEKELLTLDPDKPLVVRGTPEYMRGFSIASISTPGPYDSGGDTYYNVSPIDHMTEDEAASFLREYNNYTLQILNIHEAVPGHYTQLVYANQAPSLIKSILRNTAMIEGWAVYVEQMMLEEGYGEFQPELWLMYAKWHLRVVTNTILDYRIHNDQYRYTRDEGLDLLMNRAFQEQTEAEGKWRRATLSQVQLTSYFTGYSEIYNFREEWKERKGVEYDIRKFHEQFLAYGSSPVRYIRELMLATL